ncbi:glycosyltransferase family 4 protein [Polynucleobacter paneuropaeus]|nr:glycosyltransferase family 4 protein [Polynucleobacter paneuropaeus]
MKILIFTEIYDCGGIDTFISNLINEWPESSDCFHIVSNFNYPGIDVIRSEVSHEKVTFYAHNVITYPNLWLDNLKLRYAKKIISPVLRYLLIPFQAVLFLGIFKKAKCDVMIVVNGGYPGGDSCRSAAIAWSFAGHNKKSFHNFHNLVVAPKWHTFLQERVIDAILVRVTSKFITVSSAALKSLSLRPWIAGSIESTYIHNGIKFDQGRYDDSKSNIRFNLEISLDSPICLMLGTYEPRKGHKFLIEAFKKVRAKIPNAHLIIAGYGTPAEIDFVKALVVEANLDNCIHLLDFISDIEPLMNQVSVLLVASQAYESFGFTSVEAMARKIPVVATAVGGVPEVVENGSGGYCLNPEDVDGYASRVIELLRSEALRLEQGSLGYQRFLDNFTAKTMASKYHKELSDNCSLK